MRSLENDGKTVVILAEKRRILGMIAVADTIRKTSADAVRRLGKMGIGVYMMTGDNERTARAIAKQVGIGNVWVNRDVFQQDCLAGLSYPAGNALA